MTINNRTYAQPNIAVILYRVLRVSGILHTLDEVLAMCAPPAAVAVASTREPTDHDNEGAWSNGVKETLGLLVEFGILAQMENQYGTVAGLAAKAGDETDQDFLSRQLRYRFLQPEHNENLWASDAGARDFTRLITWYLMQEIEDPPRGFAGVAPLQHEQLASSPKVLELMSNLPTGGREDYLVTTARWPVFERWAVFTGLARRDVGGLLPDPTKAVSQTLSQMRAGQRIPISDFINSIGRVLPVLDTGSYWSDLLNQVDAATRARLEDCISPALSHALLRLSDQGQIRLEDRADSPDKLRLSDGKRFVPISHVEVPT